MLGMNLEGIIALVRMVSGIRLIGGIGLLQIQSSYFTYNQILVHSSAINTPINKFVKLVQENEDDLYAQHMLNCFFSICSTTDEKPKLFIAYMGHLLEDDQYSPAVHHSEMINQIIDPRKSLIPSYTRSFNGFAAHLSLEEVEKLTRLNGVLLVIPSKTLQLQTTRSWDFMGFPRRIDCRCAAESDVIMGIFDTGIWPESESFHDKGFGPVPKKWKGECTGGLNFTCNKKVIGARSYSINGKSFSARDIQGHGMHVASIATGNEVKHPSYFDLAEGTARGALDDAIADGVDMITIAVALDSQHEPNSDVVHLKFSKRGTIYCRTGQYLSRYRSGLVYETYIDQYDNIWSHALQNSANSTFVNTICLEKLEIFELNYPSMAVLVEVKTSFVVSFPRRVTNVGQANATYVASIQKESSKLNFSVEPSKLEFTSQNQMISFVVTVKGSIESSLTTESVSLTWTDGIHVVRSPIVVYTGEVFSGVERASRPPSFLVAFVIFVLVFIFY
ncbi:putative cucumisin [Tanacetum coccineum]